MLSSDIPIKTKEDQSNSIDENIKIKTLTTEHRETSTDDVKSFVIVNDINVEEEISKAQKDTQNFFQVLSMSFYGRMRSHSFDNQDSREVQKTPSTPQNEAKSALTRKRSAQTPSESKLSASKEMKPKTPGVLKKQALPTKELELIPEKSQKRLLSPKVDIGKMYSPVVSAGKKALVGNFTAKAAGKKETSGFVFDIQQPRPQTGKRSGEEGNRIGITADMIMSSSGRSTPMRVELPKKISLSKLGKTPKKVAVENIEEEKIVTISVDPSVLDIQDYQDGEDDKDRISCQDSTSKDGKVKKTTSRRGSDKNLKDKPATVTNNFVKGSATKSQPKINLKDGQDIHEFLLEQKKASTPLGVSSSNKEIKRGKKPVKKKANSQESNMDFSQDKLKNIVLSDLQDLGDDDEKAKTTKNDSGSKTVKKKSSVGKLDRQRSPDVVGKLYERIPTIMNNGIGDWGVKAAMITKYDLTRKAPQQKEMKEKEKEGTFFEMPGKKIDTMAPPASRELSKSKKSSMEKLGKGDKPSGQSTPAQSTQQLPTQPNQGQGKEGNNKEKKIETSSPGKEAYVRKLDNTTPKDEKSVKIGDIYLKKEKSTGTKEKGRTASPMSGEGRKQGGDILDKILIQKKKEKL